MAAAPRAAVPKRESASLLVTSVESRGRERQQRQRRSAPQLVAAASSGRASQTRRSALCHLLAEGDGGLGLRLPASPSSPSSPSSIKAASAPVRAPLQRGDLEHLEAIGGGEAPRKRPSSVETATTTYQPTENSEAVDPVDSAAQSALASKDRIIAAKSADIAKLTQVLMKKDFEIAALRRHIQELERKAAQAGLPLSVDGSADDTEAKPAAPVITIHRASEHDADGSEMTARSSISSRASSAGSSPGAVRARRQAVRAGLATRQRKALGVELPPEAPRQEAAVSPRQEAAQATILAAGPTAAGGVRQRMEDRMRRRCIMTRVPEEGEASAASAPSGGFLSGIWGSGTSPEDAAAKVAVEAALAGKAEKGPAPHRASRTGSASTRSESVFSAVSSLWYGGGGSAGSAETAEGGDAPKAAEEVREAKAAAPASQGVGVWGMLWGAKESDEEEFNVWGEDDGSEQERARFHDFKRQKEKVEEEERAADAKLRLKERREKRKQGKSPTPSTAGGSPAASPAVSPRPAQADAAARPSTAGSTPSRLSDASTSASPAKKGSFGSAGLAMMSVGKATTKFRPSWRKPAAAILEKE